MRRPAIILLTALTLVQFHVAAQQPHSWTLTRSEDSASATVPLLTVNVCGNNMPGTRNQFSELMEDLADAVRAVDGRSVETRPVNGEILFEIESDLIPKNAREQPRRERLGYSFDLREERSSGVARLFFRSRDYARRSFYFEMKPSPGDVVVAVFDELRARYGRRSNIDKPLNCAEPPPPGPAKRTPVTLKPPVPANKWAWTVYDLEYEVLETDARNNVVARQITDESVALVQLRARRDNIGTTAKINTTYQINQLKEDFITAGKHVGEVQSRGFSLLHLQLQVDGASYSVNALYRAVLGAKEELFHATLSYDQDASRVAVYVKGPSPAVRHHLIAEAQRLYSKRPAVLDCTGELPRDHPRRVACYPTLR